MLELMTWSEIVDSLREDGNLKMAAVFDLQGEKLAATQGVTISKMEIIGVLRSLLAPCSNVYALFLGGTTFRCLQIDDNTLIGRGPSEVFVAYKHNDVLICGYNDFKRDSKISCLASVKNFAIKLNLHPVPDAVASPGLI